jgi:chromosome segregation ATPase
MEHASIWTRMGQWFKAAGRGGQKLPKVSSDGLLDDDEAFLGGDNGEAGDTAVAAPLTRRRQREQALEKLQQGYEQVIGLVDSIHTHLQAQDERTRQIAEALTRLANTTGRIPDAAEAQSQQLATIASQLEASNDRARRWEKTLFDLPKLAEAQRETLSGIGQELQSARQSDDRMAGTLDGLRDAVHSLGESSAASTRRLESLQEAASQRDESLHHLMKEQNKRFIWLFVVTLILAAAAIAIGVLALLR